MSQALLLQLKERLDNIKYEVISNNPCTKTILRELDLCKAYVDSLESEE